MDGWCAATLEADVTKFECQSGMIMAAAALLARIPHPTDEDINTNIRNLCRCGTDWPTGSWSNPSKKKRKEEHSGRHSFIRQSADGCARFLH